MRWWFWGSMAVIFLGFVITCIIAKSLEPLIKKPSLWIYGIVAVASVAFGEFVCVTLLGVILFSQLRKNKAFMKMITGTGKQTQL